MEQYIDKDTLVAEIEKTINEPYPTHDQQCDWEDGYCGGLYKALSIIEDTLKVKDVDLKLTMEDVSMIRQIMFDYNRQVRSQQPMTQVTSHKA